MIDLKECRKNYYDHTGKASDVQRQLSFAGIAVIWLFRTGNGTDQAIPDVLTFSLILFVSAIASDLLQYLSSGILWGVFSRIKEKTLDNKNEKFLAPKWINWPGIFFYSLKFIFVIWGYGKLLVYLSDKLIQ